MKISSIEPHIVKEARDQEASTDAEEISTRIPVSEIHSLNNSLKEEPESSLHSPYSRSDHVIDFVAKARKKRAEILGKKKYRAIRSYQSIASFEDSFIFKGRFYRNA